MRLSWPLVLGSLMPLYPLIQTVSHNNREEKEEESVCLCVCVCGGGMRLRMARTGWRKEETRLELVGFAGAGGGDK